MDALQFFFVVLLVSVVAGCLGSILGLGGGVVIVPVLTLFLGVPPLFAIGASIVSVIATSSGAASAYVKEKMANVRIGVFLELATTSGAVVGALLTLTLERDNLESLIYLAFGAVLVISVLPLIHTIGEEVPANVVPDGISRRLELSGQYCDRKLGDVSYEGTHSLLGLAIMYVAGLISGLLGIGSGVLKVVALDAGMKIPMKVSSATSNFMIGVTAAASAGIFYLSGYIDPFIVAPVILGVLGGSVVGSRVLPRASNSMIKRLFIPVILILAFEMILKGM